MGDRDKISVPYFKIKKKNTKAEVLQSLRKNYGIQVPDIIFDSFKSASCADSKCPTCDYSSYESVRKKEVRF